MSTIATKKMIAAYVQNGTPTRFMSGMFASPAGNFHATESVELDIERSGEDVAVVINDLSTGYNMNSADLYTNKSFIPPIFKEAQPLNSFDLLKRGVGANPFGDINFQAEASFRALKIARKTEDKIRRSMELQASQVLQTGIVTLIDANGATKYTLDYKPKATHFPTSGTAWDQVGDDKLGDLLSLSNVIRADGLHDPDQLVFGETAFDSFMNDATVLARLDNRRIEIGEISPQNVGEGATLQGRIRIGNYLYTMWTYSGRYKHPQTSTSTTFMDPAKVIMRSSTGRMDATFGAIPSIVAPDSRVLPYLPPRISNVAGGLDMFVNAWLSDDGENLMVGSSSRPLMIPTAIDTYGCLTTGL